MNGKCIYCGKLTNNVNDLICVYEGYYCSKKCVILSLIEKQENITQILRDTIKSLNE